MDIKLKTRKIYKPLKDFVIGDKISSYDEDRPSVISIQKNGFDDVYKITLTDGRSFRCGKNHLTTVSFRTENGRQVWDTLTTHWMKDNIGNYNFEVFSDPKKQLTTSLCIKMCAEHENEPSDNINPILSRDKNKVYIKKIEKLPQQKEQWCLTLNDPLGLYQTANGIWTHNSTFTMMALLYVACLYGLMRDPWKFYSKAKTTIFAITLCAVTLTKAKEIYEEPIRQLIESADFWKQCRTHSEMMLEEKHLQECDEVEYLPWKNGSTVSVFNTGNNLQWKVISNANSLLGVNILMGCMTEITFFLEAGKGWTNQKIFNFFSKLKERISNRFQNAYLARMILDSSPSTLEDPIQNYMTYDAPELEESFIWKGSRWDLYPEEFPYYCDVENKGTIDQHAINIKTDYSVAFQLYKGGNGKPPIACENALEASQYQPTDLIWCPRTQVTKNGTVNFLQKAKDNPIEFMKDWAGLPAGTPDRLFYREDWIENPFQCGLKNLYGAIVALADEQPEHLIWNQIEHRFFRKMLNRYKFYYEPDLPRTVSVDLSKAKDCTGISMSHVELDPERIDEHTGKPLPVYVTDFTVVLIPKGGHINMDAVKYFIHDLKYLGGINLRHVAFDGWQSDAARQFLKRDGIAVDYVSVDRDNEPYYNFYDLVTHGRWYCGRNIFMKNNMKSLHEVRRVRTGSVKIDHFEGPVDYAWEDGTWESCAAGTNAKDCADSVVSSLYLMQLYPSEFIATKKFYKDDNLDKSVEDIALQTAAYSLSGKLDGGKWV